MKDACPPFYELIVLGTVTQDQMDVLDRRLNELAVEFQLTPGSEIILRSTSNFSERSNEVSNCALYFGGDPGCDQEKIQVLADEKVPIVPVVRSGDRAEEVLPSSISDLNAAFLASDDAELEVPFAVALECLGLLHHQRRLFVSYRRTESREVAVQLHDELSGRGFDVFLDTHDIRPGLVFQEMLWHRLVDCDVVIMLDTPDYFGSKWTSMELGRSQSKGIQILRLVWPSHVPTRKLSLSDTLQLQATDFTPAKQLITATVDCVARRAERLRSRSIATRQLSLAGKFISEVERIGGTISGIGAYRAIAAELPNGLQLQAYPMVGIPSAQLLHDVEIRAQTAGSKAFPCLVYDHVGIRQKWIDHLKWLDDKIREVRTLRVAEAAWELVEWDNP